MKKIATASILAVLALTLSACNKSTDSATATPSPSGSWSVPERNYLTEIFNAHMAANEVIPAEAYLTMGNTVCQGYTQGKTTEELSALMAATAEKNGLPKSDRQVFGPTIMAAAVTHLCPENINKIVTQK